MSHSKCRPGYSDTSSVARGYIFYGNLTALPALRDAGFSFSRSEYESHFHGHILYISFFIGKNFNNYTFGIGFIFNHRWLKLENNNHIYNSRDVLYFSANFEFFGGIRF